MTPPPTPPAESLSVRVQKTVFWGVALSFARQLASIGLGLMLARLISPAVFGQYMTLAAILALLMSISMDRFNESLFFAKDPQPEDFHRHLGFGLALHGVLFLVANGVALSFAFNDRLRPIQPYFHLASLSLLLNIPRIYCINYLKYYLNWKTLRVLEIASFLTYALPALAIALTGRGLLALSIQQLMLTVPFVVYFFFLDKRLRALRFDFSRYRAALRFGVLRTINGTLYQAYAAIESLVFSLSVGFQSYGYFNRARGLAQLFAGWITDATAQIVFPALAKLAPGTDSFRRAAGLLLRVALWTGGPAATVCAMVDRVLVPTLYGHQWLATIPLVKPLLLLTVCVAIRSMADLIILTGEGAGRNLLVEVAVLLLNLLSLTALFFGGLQTFAIALATVNIAVSLVMVALMCLRKLLAARDVLRIFAPALVAAVLGVGASYLPFFQHLMDAAPLLAVAIAAAFVGLVMAISCRLLDADGARDLLGLLPGGKVARALLLLG